MTAFIKKVSGVFLDLIYPPKCIICGTIQDNGSIRFCGDCSDRYTVLGWMSGACRVGPHEKRISGIYSVFPYQDEIKHAIWKFKFQDRSCYSKGLAELMAGGIYPYKDLIDVIVPVPISKERLRQRGYNQSELIAKDVGALLKIPVAKNSLCKTKHIKKQSSLKGRDRYDNITGAYGVIDKGPVYSKRVLLIDDVLTTGSTIGECAEQLWNAGADKVYAGVVAMAQRGGQNIDKAKTEVKMKLFGRLIKNNYTLIELMTEDHDDSKPFNKRLEKCFIEICRDLDIGVPIWLDKNTTEFACFRKTYFMPDQFIDTVRFDKMQIQLEDY